MTPAELEERLLAVEKKVGIRSPLPCGCYAEDYVDGHDHRGMSLPHRPEPPKKGWTAREGDLVKYESSPMGGGISYSKGVEIHPQAVRMLRCRDCGRTFYTQKRPPEAHDIQHFHQQPRDFDDPVPCSARAFDLFLQISEKP